MVQHLSAEEIIQYISDAKKSTPLKVYVNGNFDGCLLYTSPSPRD